MNDAEQFMQGKLRERTSLGMLRTLSTTRALVDFSSNDYLGFACSGTLAHKAKQIAATASMPPNGSGGSRLLTGNYIFAEETESLIATFHRAESGLLFNSGYDANLGLLSSLPQRGHTIIADELVHASIKDGSRLSAANRYTFRHNDLNHLETKLKRASGIKYVVVESVYSMDGDLAPLAELSKLCESYNAALIVDEAHATGVFGDHGRGLVCALNLEQKVFARIVTFGKALGSHGAIVLGSSKLRDFMINFSRSFIYTTALPFHTIATIRAAYDMLAETDYSPLIGEKISLYAKFAASKSYLKTHESAIQIIPCDGNTATREAAQILQNKGFDVRPILSPTVRIGNERLRVCLHLYNSTEEIKDLLDTIDGFIK